MSGAGCHNPVPAHPSRTTDPLRYHAFSSYLLARFGQRVRRIPLDAGFGCPNRPGPEGRGGPGCIYCANEAFSPDSAPRPPPLEEQLASGIEKARRKSRASAFIAYFQAFTNTWAPVETLRERYDTIRRFPEIRGLAVGTRPDCVDSEVLDLLESYCHDYEVWIEYGLQSASDEILARIRRGHTVEDFVRAVEATARRPALKICAHVILGLPGESPADRERTAALLARLPVHGVKIHHCHVVRGTPLADAYLTGAYEPPEYGPYVGWVCDFLERVPWSVTVQRLTGEAPAGLLLAPRWGRTRSQVSRDVQGEFLRRGTRQGSRVESDKDRKILEVP